VSASKFDKKQSVFEQSIFSLCPLANGHHSACPTANSPYDKMNCMLLIVRVSKNKDASAVNGDETSISKHIASMLSKKTKAFPSRYETVLLFFQFSISIIFHIIYMFIVLPENEIK